MELNAVAEAPAARVRAVDPDAELVARARGIRASFSGCMTGISIGCLGTRGCGWRTRPAARR